MANSQASWRDRVFVRAFGDAPLPPSIQINYSLDGLMSAIPLGHELTHGIAQARAGGFIRVLNGNDFIAGDSNELVVDAPDGDSRNIYFASSFSLPLLSTGDEGDYYCDLSFELGSYVVQQILAATNNYDVYSDFSNTFYLTGATANGMSLEEAGVTLEFQSQLERAALAEVPEPSSIALLGSGALGLICIRRRRAVGARVERL